MTKADKAIVRAYERSKHNSLHSCYGSYSNKKYEAWEYCEKLKEKYNGEELKVISYNGWMFTAGFHFTNDEGYPCLMYITKSQDKIIEIDEDMED